MSGDSDDSDSIEFERSGSTEVGEGESSGVTESTEPKVVESPLQRREIQFMYIQMEFCEKSTLRTAIDSGLYRDTDRVYRLFREIVEGEQLVFTTQGKI